MFGNGYVNVPRAQIQIIELPIMNFVEVYTCTFDDLDLHFHIPKPIERPYLYIADF